MHCHCHCNQIKISHNNPRFRVSRRNVGICARGLKQVAPGEHAGYVLLEPECSKLQITTVLRAPMTYSWMCVRASSTWMTTTKHCEKRTKTYYEGFRHRTAAWDLRDWEAGAIRHLQNDMGCWCCLNEAWIINLTTIINHSIEKLPLDHKSQSQPRLKSIHQVCGLKAIRIGQPRNQECFIVGIGQCC